MSDRLSVMNKIGAKRVLYGTCGVSASVERAQGQRLVEEDKSIVGDVGVVSKFSLGRWERRVSERVR